MREENVEERKKNKGSWSGDNQGKCGEMRRIKLGELGEIRRGEKAIRGTLINSGRGYMKYIN